MHRSHRIGTAGLAAVALLSVAGVAAAATTTTSGAASGFEVNLDDCDDPAGAQEPITEEILVGLTAPRSGPQAAPTTFNLEGIQARIDAANAAGGINGIPIRIEIKDDGFEPDKAKANVTELIHNFGVDVLGSWGSGQLGAVADDQNAACVPMLYAASAATQFRDIEIYPWTVQYLPSGAAEADWGVALIQSTVENPVVGIAHNESASGVAAEQAFAAAAEAAGLEIATVIADTDPASAATTLAAANVNVVYHAGVTGACASLDTALARVGFEPELKLNASNCSDQTEYEAAGDAADGGIIPMYLKDPASPLLADDEGVALYLSQVEGKVSQPLNTITVSGWVQGDLFVNTLQQAADSPDGLTRVGIIKAARDQRYHPPMFIEGVDWLSTPERLVGQSAFQAMAWNAAEKRFEPIGEVVDLP